MVVDGLIEDVTAHTPRSSRSDTSLVVSNKDNPSAYAENHLTMSPEKLRIDLQKKTEEAAYWKFQYIQFKKQFERCKRAAIGSFGASSEDLDTEDVSESHRETSDESSLTAKASSPIDVTNGNGGKERNCEGAHLPQIIKPRKKFPLPTSFVLRTEVMAICKDRSRDVRTVASDALSFLFSEEVLGTSCIIGPRTRNPDSVRQEQKPRGPPLDKEILNALLNACHKIFTKKKSERRDPKWYRRFMSSAKYLMSKLRKKGGIAAEEPLRNYEDSRDDPEENENVGNEDDDEELHSDG
ncbi:hypothetical protein QAD02_013362 [Eretmocerus hayati]|uniref:Uncharacterized protein n=1 Tax=Eretmocerus hayati TaxID=131215 RepID=A0ACC2P1X0_9HYME|nr:hypothetical protein QAD02_013362 [Eretmocerus hayati]